MKKVYVETSVIGAYYENRTDVASAAQREWTQQWWDEEKPKYEIVSSEAVTNELAHPNYPHSQEALKLMKDISKLSIETAIIDITNIYISKKLMPQDPVGDALHLAICSFHKCDYLLTWNCKHIANPNKLNQIRIINVSMGLFVPTLVTPYQLIGDYDE